MVKILRNINEELWREVKSQAALEGMSMASWVEKVLAEKLRKEYLLGQKKDRRRKELDKGAVSPQAKLLLAIFGEGSTIKTEAGLKERLNSVLETLRPDERRVLQLRFGLEDGQSRTLEEVGREFGITGSQIWQIEAKALRKLRHPNRSQKLKKYIQGSQSGERRHTEDNC